MNTIKKIIGQLPIIGYVMRWFSGVILLPRHLSRFHHTLHRHTKKIADLEAGLLRANRQIIELEDRLDSLKNK